MQRRLLPLIEVFADIWCPFAHVGLRAVQKQLALEGRSDAGVWVRAWPLELVNGAPVDPAATKEHAETLRGQVAPDLFSHLDIRHFPKSTLDALALVNRAYRTDLQLGTRVSYVLRDALFEEGRDISDPGTLERMAHDLGVVMPDETDRDAVLSDWHEGQRRGVLGSPHFFCGNTDAFCPSLDVTKGPAAVTRDVSRLTAFLQSCLDRSGPE